jgi:hypothetical protein
MQTSVSAIAWSASFTLNPNDFHLIGTTSHLLMMVGLAQHLFLTT